MTSVPATSRARRPRVAVVVVGGTAGFFVVLVVGLRNGAARSDGVLVDTSLLPYVGALVGAAAGLLLGLLAWRARRGRLRATRADRATPSQ
ncbi:MAG: hypothetical protein JWN08_2423 [Frankiales bacterium]|nr:hypothetical protein [Frankiales bacterium]